MLHGKLPPLGNVRFPFSILANDGMPYPNLVSESQQNESRCAGRRKLDMPRPHTAGPFYEKEFIT
jgi:hypothetical protein